MVHEFLCVFPIKRQAEVSKIYEMSKKYVRIGKPREISIAQKKNLEKMRNEKNRYELDAKPYRVGKE